MKTRSSSGVGQKVDLEFNIDTLRITDLGEEEQGQSPNQIRASGGSSVYAGLKKTSTVTANSVDGDTGEIRDPNQGIALPKVRADVGGAKIRQLLAGLNSEKD
jgi:hypothetical protein